MAEDPNTSMAQPPPATDPRAIAQNSGIVFHSAGLILMFGSCCVGSFFGLAQPSSRAALGSDATSVFELWSAFPLHQKLATISMFANVVAGLGALAAGIGMQHDRYGSPRLALLVALPMAAYHAAYVLSLLIAGPIRAWFMMPLLLGAAWTLLSVLALVSLHAHRQHPPPRGPEKLPPGFKLPATQGERVTRNLNP